MTDQEGEDFKRELLFKFSLLKQSYPSADIPEVSVHSDYRTLKNSYDSVLRKVSLNSSVDSYKQWLIAGFLLVEFFLGNMLKFDMEGYTRQQMVQMHKYDTLLIELGEKSYVPEGSRWPVELRLLGIIIMNAAMFVLMKTVQNKSGSMNIFGMFNNLSSSSQPTRQSTTNNGRRRRMRGPDVDIDDMPDLPDIDDPVEDENFDTAM